MIRMVRLGDREIRILERNGFSPSWGGGDFRIGRDLLAAAFTFGFETTFGA